MNDVCVAACGAAEAEVATPTPPATSSDKAVISSLRMNNSSTVQCGPAPERADPANRVGRPQWRFAHSLAPGVGQVGGVIVRRVSDEFSAESRLRSAREREHVLVALARAQAEWREVLAIVEDTANGDEAEAALSRSMGFSSLQARAVTNTQFMRVSRADRDRVLDELAELRREIEGLEDE